MKKLLATFSVTLLIAGCASVPMDSPEASAQAKSFEEPAQGNAGLYIYRDSFIGKALKQKKQKKVLQS